MRFSVIMRHPGEEPSLNARKRTQAYCNTSGGTVEAHYGV